MNAARLRGFAFTDVDFQALRAQVRAKTGIYLSDSKRELVYSRVARRLRALGLDSFRAYRLLLDRGDSAESTEFCNAITTNLTAFYREAHHFEYLREHLLEPWARTGGRRRLRIWSAGCSSGEEPYTIAMTIAECVPHWQVRDVKVLATDIDSQVLAHAAAGCYADEQVARVGAARIARHFEPVSRDGRAHFAVRDELAALITFRQLNLMHALPMHGPLQAIFCRNVAIYFDKATQRDLFARMARLQRTGDLLFVGHSESLFRVAEEYALVGKTIYRRS